VWAAIKKILPFNINKLGLGQILEFNEICVNWDKIMDNFFSPDFKNKSKPISLKNKILVVDCLSSVWASELQLKQPKIIEEINKKFNKGLVEKIKFIS
jgi:predicted nucleic acid-binding Zn ribbon protein